MNYTVHYTEYTYSSYKREREGERECVCACDYAEAREQAELSIII